MLTNNNSYYIKKGKAKHLRGERILCAVIYLA